ncbi:ATP-binding protein [Deferribacteres bacterium DY0037]|uniref:ATP-binding protein n=1 Tax=Denitrovibrio acetiphilus TaxID=118000 RepID=UPI000321CA00
MLYLLFSNLINNALKYAPDQTNVDITITNTKENTKITITNRFPRVNPGFYASLMLNA